LFQNSSDCSICCRNRHVHDRAHLQNSPCRFKRGPKERWPSGLRRTLGKRVCGKLYRGFESHSLRHIGRHSVFSERSPWKLSPVSVGVSDFSSGPPAGRIVLFFSETPVSLRISGLHPFSTVLEIPLFRVGYEFQRKAVRKYLLHRREPLISILIGQDITSNSPRSRSESSRPSQTVGAEPLRRR
jgi:hypothetical protein